MEKYETRGVEQCKHEERGFSVNISTEYVSCVSVDIKKGTYHCIK